MTFKSFSVNEKLLRASSIFFDKVFSNAWSETTSRGVKLPEESPLVFNIYLRWLNSGKLFAVPSSAEEPARDKAIEYINLGKCFMLGDTIQDEGFKDCVCDAFLEYSADTNRYFVGSFVELIYKQSTEGSPHRLICVDMALNSWPETAWSKVLDDGDCAQQFCLDVLKAYIKHKNPSWKLFEGAVTWIELKDSATRCRRYHEHHRTGNPCYRTRFKHLYQ